MLCMAVDGNSLANRAFFGVRPLTNREGLPTQAVYGFFNLLLKAAKEVCPDQIVVCFDVARHTFRHDLYQAYKGTRKGMPEELAVQMPFLRLALHHLGLPVLGLEGFEADDLLGTLAAQSVRQGHQLVIVTGDRDALQLVQEGVSVRLLTSSQTGSVTKLMTPKTVLEEYALPPQKLIDLKAIMGDSSDNIPGVPGIGQKGATKLLADFGSLEGIYEQLDSPLITKGTRQKLEDGKESAFLSRTLGTICQNAPLALCRMTPNQQEDNLKANAAPAPSSAPIEAVDFEKLFAPMGQLETALAIFARLELNRLLERRQELLALTGTPCHKPDEALQTDAPPLPDCAFQSCNAADFLTLCQKAPQMPVGLCFAEETAHLVAQTETAFVAAKLSRAQLADFSEQTVNPVGVFSLQQMALTGHVVPQKEATPTRVTDLSLAAYLLYPTAGQYAPEALQQTPPALPQGLAAPQKEAAYLAAALPEYLTAIHQKGLAFLLWQVEQPLALVLAEMEQTGMFLDTAQVEAFGLQLAADMADLEQEIYALAGRAFLLSSPKQLATLLFEAPPNGLGLPAGKKTKTGYSTNAEVLEGLKHAHPIVEKILLHRQLAKLYGTYTGSLVALADQNGRVHSHFVQTETRTGRISSVSPNLQNIPVRTDRGRQIRSFFKAPPGRMLCDADYSQIELRVLAHLSGDPHMTEAFVNGEDIHTQTAQKVFGTQQVTAELRRRAKAVNFGIVYGQGPFSLAQDLGVGMQTAKQYIAGYFTNYPLVDACLKQAVQDAEETGYSVTLFGRIRPIPELKAANKVTHAFGERVARNTPIQGTAADIIKIAMIRVSERLEREKLDAQLILQVHDELIVECRADIKDTVCDILREEMLSAANLKVELSADVGCSDTWYGAKG